MPDAVKSRPVGICLRYASQVGKISDDQKIDEEHEKAIAEEHQKIDEEHEKVQQLEEHQCTDSVNPC